MNDISAKKVLFLGKKNDELCEQALAHIQKYFGEVEHHLGEWGDPLPETAKVWQGDLIISYLSRWVVPEYLLRRANFASINFHPASPEYPGIGCVNFALYDGVSEYGVTCHHMEKVVDTGDIIRVKRFPVEDVDSVETLLQKSYEHQIELFYEIIDEMMKHGTLPTSQDAWSRLPYTRKEFHDLFIIEPNMTPLEIERRIRAVSYGERQPAIKLHGRIFRFVPTESSIT